MLASYIGGEVGKAIGARFGADKGAIIGQAMGSEVGTIGYFILTEIMTIDGKTLPEHAKAYLYDLFEVEK
jgi:hypothetical protein